LPDIYTLFDKTSINAQRDCFVANAPCKDSFVSLRAKRSNLIENPEVWATNCRIHGLRGSLSSCVEIALGWYEPQ